MLYEYLNDFYIVYIDDILIYSDNDKKHIKHVRLVLERLREMRL